MNLLLTKKSILFSSQASREKICLVYVLYNKEKRINALVSTGELYIGIPPQLFIFMFIS